MQILELPEKNLKKQLNIYALKYVRDHSYYKYRKIINDFLILVLDLSPNSKTYTELKEKTKYDLIKTTHKLFNMGIITRFNNNCYKINKNIGYFDAKLDIIKNSINKEKSKKKRFKI